MLFVVLPAVELGLLIEIGTRSGTAATLGLIAATGVVGASLARRQGLGVVAAIQRETAAGRLPAGTLVDGVIILLAGALLVTPGVLTDVFGFLCLLPAFRRLVKRELVRRLERAARDGRVDVRVYTSEPWEPREEKEVRDIGPRAEPSEDDRAARTSKSPAHSTQR